MKKEATATYQWQGDGIIQRVDIRTQDNGRAVAYIYADDSNARQPERNAVRTALRGKGWGTLSDHSGDQFSLRVSGITNAQDIIDLITQQGYVSGAPTVTSKTTQDPKSKGFGGFIKDNSLRISAAGYSVGDALYYTSGAIAKVEDAVTKQIGPNKERMRMAGSFAVGDIALALFGGRDDARQYKALLGKLKTHMQADGIDIPKTASIHVETAPLDEGFSGKSYDFLHTHINSIKIMAEVVGGWFAVAEGLKLNNGKRDKPMLIGGLIVIAGWAGALLTKEKKPDKEKLTDASATDHAIAYIQEKPLRLAGWAGLAFNALNFRSAWDIRNTTEGHLKLAGVGSMLSANGLYAISHKAPGGDIKTEAMVSDVYSVAAQIINKQPDAQREAAIQSTAKFLGERPEIKDTHSEIITRLNKEVLIQRQNPWFENTRLAIRPLEPELAAQKIHHPDMGSIDVALNAAQPHIGAAKEATPSTLIATADSVHQAKLVAHDAALHDAPTVAL